MAQSKKRTRKVFKPLAIAALMAGAMLQPFMLPAFAAAGETISNTATATYTDDDPNNVFTTESNTVTVTIKEVAGITVGNAGVGDQNMGSFEDADILDFNFIVTNVGNDPTDIQLPAVEDILTVNFDAQTVTVLNSAGDTVGSYVVGDAAPLLSDLTDIPTLALDAGDTLTVVVTGTVLGAGLNPGDDIIVTLGDTGPNDGSDATQNQDVIASATNSDLTTADVPLADEASVPGEAPGLVAQEKEASSTLDVDFATQQTPLALATVKKNDISVDPGDTGSANDDIITYALSLRVEDTSPDGAFIPEALEKTLVTVEGSNIEAVLVSDAIPEFTEFNGTVTTTTGWVPVYSTDALTSSPVVANGSTPTNWKRFGGAAPTFTLQGGDTNADVTRIGYIWEGAEINEGTEFIEAFTFDVITSGLPAAGGNIYNLAQVFGTTFDDADPLLEDPIAQIIYDESGDPNPNNFNDDGTPPAETDGGDPDGSDFDPVNDTGVADPTNHGTDDGSNTGSGPDGEDNVVPLTGEELTGDDNILNGPDGSADAVGPTDDDDDYTNKGVDADTTNATVVFTNTVANPSTNTSEIDNVTLQPISAVQAALSDDDGANVAGKYETTPIPDGTEVTISYDPTPGNPTSGDEQEATYTYTSGVPVLNGGDSPVNVGTLEPGEELDYTVTVVFEDGDLTEDDVIELPIIAFPDTDDDGYVAETVNNITVNKVYVGFMEVTKQVRVLDADGVTVLQDWGTDLVDAESGNIIEYRITYTNTSPSLTGSGNVGLDAQNFRLVEDGDIFDSTGTDGDNNWDSDDTTPLTVHANGVVVNAGTTVTYYDEFTEDGDDNNDNVIGTVDPATGTDVEAYVNEAGTVVPGGSGTMTFRRRIQ